MEKIIDASNELTISILESKMREALVARKKKDSLDFLVEEYGFKRVHETEQPIKKTHFVDYVGVVDGKEVIVVCYYYDDCFGRITTRTIVKEKGDDKYLIDFNS